MNILVFDGHCHFCHFWVRQLIRIDRRQALRLVSFEALNKVYPGVIEDGAMPGSVWLIKDKRIYSESDAVIQSLRVLGRGSRIAAGAIVVIPARIRDVIYRFIARHRYSLFGRQENCPLPAPQHQRNYLNEQELQNLINEMPTLPERRSRHHNHQ